MNTLQLVLRYLGDWLEQIDGSELNQMPPCFDKRCKRKNRHEDQGSIFKRNHVREVQLQHNSIWSHLQTSDHPCPVQDQATVAIISYFYCYSTCVYTRNLL